MDDLEGKFEEASTKLKDTTERCELVGRNRLVDRVDSWFDLRRLRRVDVDAEHIERQAKRYEQERDQWEKKYEVRSISHRQ